jgi:hypothetical protein
VSTYYYFHCTNHQPRQAGGCWTRQAWGWGNADLVDAFKFVMLHVRDCGEQYIGMHSEHADDNDTNTSYEDEHRRPFLEAARGIFPHSDDWAFMDKLPEKTNPDDAWTQAELAELPAPDLT